MILTTALRKKKGRMGKREGESSSGQWAIAVAQVKVSKAHTWGGIEKVEGKEGQAEARLGTRCGPSCRAARIGSPRAGRVLLMIIQSRLTREKVNGSRAKRKQC